MYIFTARLICRSLLLIISPTPLICSENLTYPEPKNIGESLVNIENCLPYYTAGFE